MIRSRPLTALRAVDCDLPHGRPLHLFGCPFVNAVAELKEPGHAANKIAFAFKEQRRLWFRDLLKQLGVKRPDALAMQLVLLVDGAIAAALVRGDPKAARTLLAAAGVRPLP